MKKRYGVVDIGSLKLKLLIAEEDGRGGFNKLQQTNNLTRLGMGLDENGGRPKPQFLAATIEELQKAKQLLQEAGVEKMRIVSTHALREMLHGEEIALELKKATGLRVEIIPQQEEAELFFNAVMRDFQIEDDFAMIDVGSGSVQLLLGHRGQMQRTYLFKTGTVYLFENYTKGHTEMDAPNELEVERMRQYILEQLVPVPRGVKTPLIYGSSNIIEVFKVLGLPLDKFEYSPTHPYRTDFGEVEQFYDEIVYVPYGERIKKYYYADQPHYMWGIDTALLNVITVGKHLGSEYVIPSNSNINQGLLLSLLEQK